MKRKGYLYPLPVPEPHRAPLTLVGRPLSESNARAEGYGFGAGSSSPEQRFLSDLPTHFYNYDRPHGGLEGQTPYERLRQKTTSPV